MKRLNIDIGVVLPSVIIMIATACAGSAFFLQSRNVMSMKIREELRMAAELAAAQINGDRLAEIQGAESRQSPVYLDVVNQLRAIRTAIPNARFTYIFRRTGHPHTLAFVADADATSTQEELDHNRNGMVEVDEIAALPGELYDISEQPELQGPAFLQAVTTDVYTDQWGELISGFAPIKDARGKHVAVLGIDMDAHEFVSMSQSAFSPVSLLLVLLLGAVGSVILGYAAWSRRERFYKRLDEQRSSVISLAMHQIGAPLSSMRWWVDLMKENDKEHAETENAEGFAELDKAITRMSELIESLRKATSVAEGITEKNIERIDLYEIITDAIAAKEPESQKKHLRVNLQMDQQINVQVDRKLLAGVVQELIDNAISFSPENTQIDIAAERKGRSVTVTVKDRGYGIPAEDIGTLFREFKRASNATKYKPVGNGLGLFVARKIVELFDGRMWLQSEEGKGTTVGFVLPVV